MTTFSWHPWICFGMELKLSFMGLTYRIIVAATEMLVTIPCIQVVKNTSEIEYWISEIRGRSLHTQSCQECAVHCDSPGFRDSETRRPQLTAKHSPMTRWIFVSCLMNWVHGRGRMARKPYSVFPLNHMLVFLLTWPWLHIMVLILCEVLYITFSRATRAIFDVFNFLNYG